MSERAGSLPLPRVSGAAAGPDAERLAGFVPYAVLIYFAVQALMRIAISGNFEFDESEVVGHAGFALGYLNSHPPLYDWIVIGLQHLTGSWVVALALAKNGLLALTYLFFYRGGRVLFGNRSGGAVLSLSLLLMPQIVWQAQVTLAHSVAATAGSAALVLAVILLIDRATTARFIWLGLALAAALLSKYNTALLVAGLAAAAATMPDIRGRLFERRLAVSLVIAAVLVAPHALWAMDHLQASTARLSKLMTAKERFAIFDVPLLGLDGLAALISALAASSALLGLVWALGWRTARREAADPPLPPLARSMGEFSGRALAITLGASALTILALDLHHVHERYLTPILMLLPVFLATRYPLALRAPAARRFMVLGAVIAVAVTILWPLRSLLGTNYFSYPYEQLAGEIAAVTGPDVSIVTSKRVNSVNFAQRLPGAAVFRSNRDAPTVVVLWSKGQNGARLVETAGSCYRQDGPVHDLTARYLYFSGEVARLSMAVLRRDEAAVAAGCEASTASDPPD